MHGNVTPSTILSLKRIAKAIKKEHGIPLNKAQEVAAKREGFESFRHAQKALSKDGDALKYPFTIYVSAFWRDPVSKKYGRATVGVPTRKLLSQLAKPHQLKINGMLSNCTVHADDHLSYGIEPLDQESIAIDRCCQIARLIQFMDITSLVPSKAYQRALPKVPRYGNDTLPKEDHSTVWYDPHTQKYLLADQPYEAAIKSKYNDRHAWAERYGFDIVRPEWKGTYNPHGGTIMELISNKKKGVPLEPIVTELAAAHPPITPENWKGIVAFPSTSFCSPLEEEEMQAANSSKRLQKVQRSRAHDKLAKLKVPENKMNDFRKLLVLGVNEAVRQGKLSLHAPLSDEYTDENGYLMTTLAGRPAVVIWSSIGFGEIRVSVWWDYDHSKHPQAELTGSSREQFQTSRPLAKKAYYPKFVGATASAWLERKTGCFLQGTSEKRIFDTYLRRGMKAVLREIPDPKPLGYEAEGRFFI